MNSKPSDFFWETKPLNELTTQEWEALCDRCGLCCLNRIQVEEGDTIYLTRVACRCYDIGVGQCGDYPNRFAQVEGCTQLTIERISEFTWLPETCAYRLRFENKPLPSWHPLISGTPLSVREHGIHKYDPVNESDNIDLEDYVIDEGVGDW
ncbi:YcgN family cysteine cluster protein [Sulfuricurvum sp.]|uniref:YcgN family cysteine cluster protein n=1 Tax=Sulfuricurvum sp. TaxID=2025608 RepID=UPI0019C718DE|nr:YcgN family cysteine cluster protein [Sulfuricurvum sp.]MBD3799134.1 YcgN family cysteine cluster protein [Campylobacterota bacterium]MBD3806596.1 YcgN family cysteine cluster protein [Sulfuricurvum sp.]